MSTAKRSRQRQPDQTTSSSLHPAKRAKIANQPQQTSSGLAFLTDERQRSGKTISAKPTNGIETSRVNRVDESNTAISAQDAVDDDDEADDDDQSDVPSSSGEDADDEPADVVMTNGDTVHGAEQTQKEVTNGSLVNGASEPMTNDVSEPEVEQEDTAGPSFGELLQSAHPEIIDVTASFDGPDSLVKSQNLSNSKALQAPSATSLGTVLSQALRTNDKDLLESCLQTKDIATIKSTIQRLQSALVATLMQKLAERLHKRPGRAGPLLVWVQWSLVAHGGYLAGQPQVVRRLKSLRQVVKERAGSLQALITLKGKLDLLGAQIELRRSIRSQHEGVDESDESDDDIVYVEGDEYDSSSDEEDGDIKLIQQTPRKANGVSVAKQNGQLTESDNDMDGDVPLINGIDEDAEMESLAEDDDEEDLENVDLIDDEAEESEGEESVSSEEDESNSASDAEEDDNEDDSSSEDDTPAAALPKSSRPTRRVALLRKR